MKKTILLILTFLSVFVAPAQELYWVFFTDKNDVDFDPYSYFDSKAIQRRVQQQIPLYDSTDFPLNSSYVNVVSALSEEVVGESRWFNAAAVTTNRIDEISRLPFVAAVSLIETRAVAASVSRDEPLPDALSEMDKLHPQLLRMEGERFVANGIDGSGIRIAVLDGGFKRADVHPAFQHLRDGHRIVKTYNFPLKCENVYGWSSHGTMVLSCIAGISDVSAMKIGLATGAEFLLARTEVDLEPRKEEVWWTMGMEWADRNGANIINSSLGYGKERYNPDDMDGTSMVARAANMAASKGILVCNSMGNEGDDRTWYTIITPADADSVISVGGIDEEGYPSDFTSWGPTADGRLKPNVCAYGHAFVANPSKSNPYTYAYGTSFSSPLIAGFAACAWQTRPQLTNMQLKAEIEKSADRYPQHDFRYGYGVPQASYFVGKKAAVGELGTIKGCLTHQRGAALEYAYVFLKKEGVNVNHAMTDANGKYQFYNVPAGTYEITFDAKLITYCGAVETETGIVLDTGEELVVNHEMDCSSSIDLVDEDSQQSQVPVPRKRGVNARYNFAPYLSWGFVAPAGEKDSKPVNYGKSESFLAGLRFKGNICKWYSLGVAVEMGATWYNLSEVRSDYPFEMKDSLRYNNLKKENIRVSFLQAEFYQRFRFVPGGISGYGLFLDLGVYGGWNFYARHKTITETPFPSLSDSKDDDFSYRVKISTPATYIADFQWGVRARFGFDIIAIYAQYRINRLDIMPGDMEHSSSQGWKHTDFPALEFGLQLTLPIGR